jgi:hypothetical protein
MAESNPQSNPPITPRVLFLAELEAQDPHPVRHGSETRFLCPFCGDSKPRDNAHRCLNVNTAKGLWNCKRCGARGRIGEFQQERAKVTQTEWQRGRLRRAFELPPLPVRREPETAAEENWREHLKGTEPIPGTAGARYLEGRGIAGEFADCVGVLFAPRWYGRPAVVFELRDEQGRVVAAQGRFLSSVTGTKAITVGPKKFGAFSTPGAWHESLPGIILTEAPIDALSLAMAGYPAVALCGTSGPLWLQVGCGLRPVLLAFDADEAGDKVAAELEKTLAPYGVRCRRLRPEGAKDWNEVLLRIGRDALADWLALRVLMG